MSEAGAADVLRKSRNSLAVNTQALDCDYSVSYTHLDVYKRQVLNNGMYVLCFMCLQIEVGGFAFTMTVLCFTVIYILAALVIVYRRAPATFRVK